MQEEFLRRELLLGLSRFISELQAKLLEHYLMFLLLPLLLLPNTGIFLQIVMSVLPKISHLDSKIARLEFYEIGCSYGQQWLSEGVLYSSRGVQAQLTLSDHTEILRKYTQQVMNFTYHHLLSCISSTAQLQKWFNRITTRTLFAFIISNWG